MRDPRIGVLLHIPAWEPGGPGRPWTTTDMGVRDARLPPHARGAEKEEVVDKAHYWEGG